MPDNWRFSEDEIERDLRDLGARIEYPPTPDVAHTVRLRLDAETQVHRARRWPRFISPRCAVAAAALVVISIVALSPTVHSGLFVSDQQTGSEAARPAAPGSDQPEDRSKQEAGVDSQAGEGEATGCPSPSIEIEPARVSRGEKLRLRGHDFASGCEGTARGIKLYLRQGGESWKLATLDADRRLTFDIRVRVPTAARPGPAWVRATTSSSEPIEKRVVVLR